MGPDLVTKQEGKGVAKSEVAEGAYKEALGIH